MARRVVTRTERRMEKKLAVTLLVLALAVSLVSFVLGVVVGKSGSRNAAPQAVDGPRERVPVAQVPLQAAPVPPAVREPEPAPAVRPDTTPKPLTFYDVLPKGEQAPLGSGINLPPVAPSAAPPAVQQKHPPAPGVATPAAPEAIPPIEPPAPLPTASKGGAYVVQAASFKTQDDARSLRERLEKKGYVAFLQEADLGEKGVWHRVLVGPFTDHAQAGEVVARLKAEEKLSGLVKKR